MHKFVSIKKKLKKRPILVKFIRIADVRSILSTKGTLSLPVFIKPDMSPVERTHESVLLKERWRLIEQGVARNDIKIWNHHLYVKNKLHGQSVDSKFVYFSPPMQTQTDSNSTQLVAPPPVLVSSSLPLSPNEQCSTVGVAFHFSASFATPKLSSCSSCSWVACLLLFSTIIKFHSPACHQQITVVLIMTTLKLSVLKRLLASTLQIDYYMSVSLMPEA